MADEDSWSEVLGRFAPLDAWNRLPPGDATLETIAVRWPRNGRQDGGLRMTLEPSVVIRPYGIYVETNDHYEIAPDDESEYDQSSTEVLHILRDEWDGAQQRVDAIVEAMMEEVDE